MPFESFSKLDKENKREIIFKEESIDVENKEYNKKNPDGVQRISLNEYEEIYKNSKNEEKYSITDFTYFNKFESKTGLYEDRSYTSSERVDLLIDQIDVLVKGKDNIDVDFIAKKILMAGPRDLKHGFFSDFNAQAVDVNSLKNTVISFLTGHGHPENAYSLFLDSDALENNVYKLDHEKIDKFITKLNNSLDKQSQIFIDKNSTYNKQLRLNQYDKDAALSLKIAIEQEMDKYIDEKDYIKSDVVDNLKTHKLLSKGLKEGSIESLNPSKVEDIIGYYNQLKGRVDNYFSGYTRKNGEAVKYDEAVLKEAKKFLKNGLCVTDKELEEGINTKEFIDEYKRDFKSGNLFLKQSLRALSKSVDEYNKHGFLWKMFVGRSARNEISKFSNNLKDLGVSKNIIDAIKDGSIKDTNFLKSEYNRITNALEGEKMLPDNVLQGYKNELELFTTIVKDPQAKAAFSSAKAILDNASIDVNGFVKEDLDFDSYDLAEIVIDSKEENEVQAYQNEELHNQIADTFKSINDFEDEENEIDNDTLDFEDPREKNDDFESSLSDY